MTPDQITRLRRHADSLDRGGNLDDWDLAVDLRALISQHQALHDACDRVREAFSFMPALNGAYDAVTVEDIRREVNDALDWCLADVHRALEASQ